MRNFFRISPKIDRFDFESSPLIVDGFQGTHSNKGPVLWWYEACMIYSIKGNFAAIVIHGQKTQLDTFAS